MAVVVKHAVIKSLPPEKLVIVENLLRLGEPYAKVGDTIHGWGLLIEVTPKTLQQALLRYAKDNKLSAINELTEYGTKANFSGGRERLDVLAEVTELYFLQKGRVAKMAMNLSDDKMGMLTNEIRVANELLRHASSLQLEVGVLKRAKDAPKEEPEDRKGSETYWITEEGKKDALAFVEALENDDDAAIR